MTTITIITEEPQVTQATEKIFIRDLPVMYKMLDLEPVEAIYNHQYLGSIDRHYITIVSDGKEVIARADELTPSRSLTDAEMIVYLTEQLYEASTSAESYKSAYQSSDDDIATIAYALREEAESRGWCQEYNEFCHQVNSTLRTGERLEALEEEYEVEVEVEATVTVRQYITVMARSQDHASELVLDDPESYFDPTGIALEGASATGWDNYDINLI